MKELLDCPTLTERQRVAVESYIKHGTFSLACREMGINTSSFGNLIKRSRAKYAAWLRMTDGERVIRGDCEEVGLSTQLPDPYYFTHGTVHMVGDEVVQSWPRFKTDPDKLREIADGVIAGLLEDARGASKRTPPPETCKGDLLSVYPVPDAHLGMLSWQRETGDKYDIETAYEIIRTGIEELCRKTPDSENALLLNLGDFLHTDSHLNKTLRSGHVLDVDTRWGKIIEVAMRLIREMMDMLLAKHKTVTLINEIGNHDDHGARVLQVAFNLFYENNDRVTVDDSPSRYHYYEFGRNLIGSHHGDGCKPGDLGNVMLADVPKKCGNAKHRHWFTGHFHHERFRDFGTYCVFQMGNPGAKDSYAHGRGYRSQRYMESFVYDRNFGIIDRPRFSVEYLEHVIASR